MNKRKLIELSSFDYISLLFKQLKTTKQPKNTLISNALSLKNTACYMMGLFWMIFIFLSTVS